MVNGMTLQAEIKDGVVDLDMLLDKKAIDGHIKLNAEDIKVTRAS